MNLKNIHWYDCLGFILFLGLVVFLILYWINGIPAAQSDESGLMTISLIVLFPIIAATIVGFILFTKKVIIRKMKIQESILPQAQNPDQIQNVSISGYSASTTGEVQQTQSMLTQRANDDVPGEGLGIASLLIALFGIGVVSLILGLLSFKQSKKAQVPKNGMAIFGVVIGGIETTITVIFVMYALFILIAKHN